MEDIKNLTFEQALQELESIVQGLESGNAPLDNAIASYERGSALKKHCAQKLAEAKSRVEKIMVNPNGSARTTPLDSDSSGLV